jgi:circadian clock protein KaiC
MIFPRLVSGSLFSGEPRALHQTSSGLERLDALLGGGLEEGTSTIITGAPGTGKSTLAAQFVAAGLARNQRAAMFLFEESADLLLNRARAINIDLVTPLNNEQLCIQPIDPAEMSPGQFTHTVCNTVDEKGVRIVVIDSLNGYINAMPNERFLAIHLRELLSYLGQRGVITLLVGVHPGMISNITNSVGDTSYLADNVILLRNFEFNGEVRQAISVFKKRAGTHERTIREFSIGANGISIGPVLRDFHGVLTGIPAFQGKALNEA